MKLYTSLIGLGLLSTSIASAQIAFTGNYFQDFNSLQSAPIGAATAGTAPAWENNVTLPGWFAGGSAQLAPDYAISDGSLTTVINASTVGVGSFGVANDSDRALAPLKRNNSAFVAVALTNNSSVTITEVWIFYDGEQWRDNAAQTAGSVGLNFSYQIGATDITSGTWIEYAPLNFDAPNTSNLGQLNGNLEANRSTISGSIVSFDFAWEPGQTLWLRWQQRGAGNNGSHVAIDNLTVIPEPSTYALLSGLLIFALILARRRKL
ncbi:MAG: PEP-CTERM sorting domain-containing protein [Verrucomicrobia bacterium]|nr:PEP-CTERM sorting domain-containing protein [Verrucomicrobiota bacterium]